MNPIDDIRCLLHPLLNDQYAEDVAALVHFSDYIAKEARRLGLCDAAEKARLVQRDLLSALEHN